jgi:uncharacterized protein (DUF983 family)
MLMPLKCGCGREFKVKSEHAGKKAKCPACGATLDIPVSPEDPVLEGPPPQPQAARAAQPVAAAPDAAAAQKACPFCAELIQASAKKCKHCGEWLDKPARPRPGPARTPIKRVAVWNIPFLMFFTLNLYWLFWLYRVVKELNDRRAMATTPGQAVGYMFIPFYNFYWVFAVFSRLGAGLRKAYEDAKLPPPDTGWVWCLPAAWPIAMALNVAAPPSGIPVAIIGGSMTLCFVQARMNQLAEIEATDAAG